MLMPSIFGEDLFDDFFGFPFDDKEMKKAEKKLYGRRAARGLDQDEQEKNTGRYIRRERYAGSCERTFYVGEDLTQEDIKAEFKHGILKLTIPKKEEQPAVEDKKYIAIEG
mgnify:CR=1 FL=1